MEYHEIGEIFEYDGDILEVVKGYNCNDCYFFGKKDCNMGVENQTYCSKAFREERENVFYRQIDECDIRELRSKAIHASIDTFFTNRELKILKMIDKQKEKRNMEQKTEIFINGIDEEHTIKINENTDEQLYGSFLNKLFATYNAKNKDYGQAFSEMFDELGIDYAYGKLREKINRIKVLRNQPNMVENEGLEDALLDTAGYAILTLVELKKRKQ